jgi:hypothetical protein
MKSKIIATGHNEEMSLQKCLSPTRGPSVNHHLLDIKGKAEIARHGDPKIRSSMYSTVKCPHCHRMFSDGAS